MGDRETSNHSDMTDFILVGFRVSPELHILLFLLFLLVYAMILLGNLGMMAIIMTDPRLNTPMYCFLGNLSFIDLFYSSVIAPKAMSNFWTESKSISFAGCVAQLFLFALFIVAEGFLLAAMAYDRHSAMCSPLIYSSIMSSSLCTGLVAGCYIGGVLNAIAHTANTFRLTFCGKNIIDHFFCDAPPLLALSCSDTYISETVIFFVVGFNALFSIVVITISYLLIFITILRMRSSEGRQKAFSTCASHLTVVFIFYGSGIFMYLQPTSSHSMDTDKIVSVFYSIVIPMLNPLVYSMRNKEVKNAFTKVVLRSR